MEKHTNKKEKLSIKDIEKAFFSDWNLEETFVLKNAIM